MSRAKVIFLVFLIVGLVAGLDTAVADEVNDFRRMIQSDDFITRQRAYAALEKLPDKPRAECTVWLVREYAKWERTYRRHVDNWAKVFKGYDKGMEGKEKDLETWRTLARDAYDLIFDTEVFPNPTSPVRGPYTGYSKVMAKVNPLLEFHEKFRNRAEGYIKSARNLSANRIRKVRDDIFSARNRVHELAPKVRRFHGAVEVPADPSAFLLGMLFLKCEDWALALACYHGPRRDRSPPMREEDAIRNRNPYGYPLDPAAQEGPLEGFAPAEDAVMRPYERALFYFLCARMVERYNETVKFDVSKNVRKAVNFNNDYRVAFGLTPLQFHEAVLKAIEEHLSTMKGMTHYGNTPETKTVFKRIRRAGYPGGNAGENLAHSGIRGGMEGWRWDGGHHRVLVGAEFVHIGASEKNGSGMNVVSGAPAVIPPVRLFEK